MRLCPREESKYRLRLRQLYTLFMISMLSEHRQSKLALYAYPVIMPTVKPSGSIPPVEDQSVYAAAAAADVQGSVLLRSYPTYQPL